MGMIPDDTIDEIRRRADIVDVIGTHVQLKKAGHNFKGLCPFHNEKTPSFNVNSEKGFFYCFGCQKKGDVFTFVMEFEGKSFTEAARALAERVGVTIPEREMSEREKRERSEKSKIYEVNKIAARFFHDQLVDERHGARARAYLQQERGLDEDTIRRFGLGFAPDSWDSLGNYLQSRKVSEQLALTAGLIKRRKQSSGYYDAFRDRVMCPVILPGGEVCGFSGRSLGSGDDAGAKYINSPESSAYKKSHLLYGIHRARDSFRKAKRAIVVEGNFDVIVLHQYGFTETVAPLGTALTEQQVDLLRRQVDEVVLVYDGDKAGRAATIKALRVLVVAGVPIRIALLPMGEDPDSLVRRDADELRQVLDRAQPGVEYFIHEVWGGTDRRSADSRSEAIGEAAELIRTVENPTKRNLLMGELAAATGADIELIRRAVGQRAAPQLSENRRPAAANRGPVPPTELEIIAILADHPTLLESAEALDVFSALTDARLRDMYSAARQGQPLLSALPEDADPHIAEHVFAGAYASLKDPNATLEQMVNQLRTVKQKSDLTALHQRAVDAGRRGEVELQRKLLEEIVTIRRRSISNGENL